MPPSISTRIVKNTLFLYFRTLLITGVSLYTVRVVLNTLGIQDYGIYSVVGGIVALCAFLPGSMASATQRFFSFALGENDQGKLKRVFTVNLVIYAVIALITLIVLESVGLWFVNEHLRVPPERFESAQRLYHISTLTFIISIFSSPFRAIILAHEDMHIYAYVSVSDAILKLAVVFLLASLRWDKLELYGLLLLVLAVINLVIYLAICLRKYEECRFHGLQWDKGLLHEIVGFTGWTLFGQLSTVARNQAVTVLLNQSFNPAVVAARAIAVNVATQVNSFAGNFNNSLYPPIIKSWAAGNTQQMYSLVINGSKLTFFLMWIFTLPLLLEMDAVLHLWLRQPPADAVLFTQLSLVEALLMSVSLPLAAAARAPGRMKTYELVLGSIQVGIFAVSWVVLKNGAPAYSVFVVAIAANVLMFFVRLFIVCSLTGLRMTTFLRQVTPPLLGVVTLSGALSLAVSMLLPQGLVFSGLAVLLSLLITAICIYFVGLDRKWREKIRNLIASRLHRQGAR